MLKGFGLTGFRSFGPEAQFIYPLSKINIFVGQNNVGKSNILLSLLLLREFLTQASQKSSFNQTYDAHRGTRVANFRWYLPIPSDEESFKELVSQKRDIQDGAFWRYKHIFKKFIANLHHSNGAAWAQYDAASRDRTIIAPDVEKLFEQTRTDSENNIAQNEWSAIWALLHPSQSGGNAKQHWIPDTRQIVAGPFRNSMPEVFRIEAHRQIGSPATEYNGLSGLGLISQLLKLQNPEFSKRDDRQKFEKINGFLESVTGKTGARLEVPHSGQELLVEIEGRLLPIQSLGTGIHEVIIFAAAATTVENSVLCIEEPEIHLHPRLQKQLLRYLQKETSNQYFITTHSAHLLDSPEVSLFHVQLNQYQESVITPIKTAHDRSGACRDLGYKPSDLVQANAIIWVEGPSDRIFLNAWINSLDEGLIEGLHYSIMFYGGRLLAHLSADDSEITEFINLQRLNRNVAIVIDSDKTESSSEINATKRRVIDEVQQSGGYGWVTAGREIENYVAAETRTKALQALSPTKNFVSPKNEFSCCYIEKETKKPALDKIKFAKMVVETVDLDILDLRSKAQGLVSFIRHANN